MNREQETAMYDQPDARTTLETHTFQWSRNYGDCSDCGLPAAYRAIDAYGAGRDQSLCSICAADAAASGQPIARFDDQPDAMNQGEHIDVSDNLDGLFIVVCACGAIVPAEEWEAHCELS